MLCIHFILNRIRYIIGIFLNVTGESLQLGWSSTQVIITLCNTPYGILYKLYSIFYIRIY